jgi:hypothetical protein
MFFRYTQRIYEQNERNKIGSAQLVYGLKLSVIDKPSYSRKN